MGQGQLSGALGGLEAAVLGACAVEGDWPAQVAAAIYAGVDFAIANPAIVQALVLDPGTEIEAASPYERLVSGLADLLRAKAPTEGRLPVSTDEALVAGIVGLVGDHVRLGRVDRLVELRPELVLLTLLPYLGFAEARRWANLAASSGPAGA